MPDDVLLNKASVIERCLRRIEEEYRGHEGELDSNLTKQDSIVLNLQRACEAAIDAAMHVVRTRMLGVPQESREAFSLLSAAGILDEPLVRQMQAMVGFRNVAVHDYQKRSLQILRSILDRRLDDLRSFAQQILTLAVEPGEEPG